MILRLDPRVPVVWRSPTCVQFGVDRVAGVFDDPSPASERMLAALAVGTPESALPVIAEAAGGTAELAAALLEAVRPALLEEPGLRPPPPREAAEFRVAVDGAGPSSRRLALMLRGAGFRLAAFPEDAVDAAVLVGSWAVSPARHGRWLRRDLPHLGVAFGETGARIGPFVEPGIGPCLACLDLERRDADPAWPAVAAQLMSVHPPAERGRFAASVLLRTVDALLARLVDGSRELACASLELARDGSERLRRHRAHARCGCRALPGTGTAGVVPLDRYRSAPDPAGPSSGAGAASRA
jgi:hypothetical protein